MKSPSSRLRVVAVVIVWAAAGCGSDSQTKDTNANASANSTLALGWNCVDNAQNCTPAASTWDCKDVEGGKYCAENGGAPSPGSGDWTCEQSGTSPQVVCTAVGDATPHNQFISQTATSGSTSSTIANCVQTEFVRCSAVANNTSSGSATGTAGSASDTPPIAWTCQKTEFVWTCTSPYGYVPPTGGEWTCSDVSGGLYCKQGSASSQSPVSTPPTNPAEFQSVGGSVSVSYNEYNWNDRNAPSLFEITFSGFAGNYVVSPNSKYLGWCVEYGLPNVTTQPVRLYSTYAAGLPTNAKTYTDKKTPAVQQNPGLLGQAIPWPELNYLLNHKQGTAAEIQTAIWLLIWGEAPTRPDAVVLKMLADAKANGGSFVPAPGQVTAVVIYVDGIGHDSGTQWQETIIEVPVPQPTVDRTTLP